MKSEALRDFFDREITDCHTFLDKWKKLKAEAEVKVQEAAKLISKFEQKIEDLLIDKKKLEE